MKNAESEMNLICKKGVYPYEWVDDNEKFKQEGLPPRKAFYSKLKISRNNQRRIQARSKRI